MICALCHDRETRDLHACPPCITSLTRICRDLDTYLAMLPLMTEPVRHAAGRAAPGYTSTSPARDDVIDATRSIPAELRALADHIADERGEHTGHPHLRYVADRLWWCAAHAWITDIAAQLRSLHRHARALACDRPQDPLGQCLTLDCHGSVYWLGALARCVVCRRPYDGLDLVRLGVQEAS